MNLLYSIDMTQQAMRAREGAAETSNERTLERLGGSGAIESAKRSDGTYRARILVEGKGSSASYSRDLLESSSTRAVMDGLKAFFDHPDYDFAPEERSVLKLAGRWMPGTVESGDTEDGLAATFADFKPRKEYAGFFEEFWDTLGISIYLAAAFSEQSDGSRKVEAFIPDPYNSIDIVVAPGAGGRFEAARESLRTIESSLGSTASKGKKPAVEASAEEKEGNMLTKEDVQAIFAEALAPVVADVAALKTAATEKATAEATAEAVDTAVSAALESYDAKVQAINAEKDLLESQRTALTESARNGEDITAALEGAKAIVTEAKAAFAVEVDSGDELGFVFEGAKDGKSAIDAAVEGAK